MSQAIAVALIDPPLFNSRLGGNVGTPDELRSLGESLKSRQLENIGVIALSDGKRYRLVWGSRRLAAAKLVGLESLNAEILPIQDGINEADEVLANGIENMQRKDLTTFEQARLCAKLRALKLSGKDVAAKLNLSVQHVSNLAICFEVLPDVIKKAWQEGQPATDMNFLRSICTKEVDGKKVQPSHDEMIAAYNERVHALAAVDDDADDDEEEDERELDEETPDSAETAGAPAPQPKYTVLKKRYKALLKALREARASQMAVDACRYLVGEIESIRGVPMKGDAKKADKAEPKTDTKKKGK